MASDRIEWLNRQVEVWNAGDLDGFFDALGPDFEFTPDPSFPDLSAYRGAGPRSGLHDRSRLRAG